MCSPVQKRFITAIIVPIPCRLLWFQLDQNTYRKDARSNFLLQLFPGYGHTDGYQFENVKLEFNGKTTAADFIVNDTRMQIRLKSPLLAARFYSIFL